MTFSKFEALDLRKPVFVDATVFIYHFTGASEECRHFLEGCERGEVKAVTSVTVLAETTHRLMLIEAVSAGLISPPNAAQKLRKNPGIVKKLRVYQEQTEKIPLMGIKVEPLDLKLILSAMAIRRRYGLMTNDSLIAATAMASRIRQIASADTDFDAVEGLTLYTPGDVGIHG